ncbi:hypothetical protein ACFXGT_11710 [Streptomyces sp. NPDC059352]|uniref:hypothetical protein n=1 Tax=Streptomyces sp. NPDC059352 TaxID=3346810 RepID=UPI0036C62C1F
MMTIKVYRVRSDGTTDSISHEQITRPTEIPDPNSFDPCGCPRHRQGWCDFHKGPSRTDAPVDEHRRACAPCRDQHGLAPHAKLVQL